MKRKTSNRPLVEKVGLAVAGLILSAGSMALADETVVVSGTSPEKTSGLYNAFEIGIGAGYSQGVGDVGKNVPSLTDSGGAGTSLELDLGWRIDPHFLVGIYGTGAWFSTGDAPGNALTIGARPPACRAPTTSCLAKIWTPGFRWERVGADTG